MAEISAKDVAALRKTTGAGMMDCKKALEETDGDLEAAKDWLREKGLAGAAKREGREADRGRDRGRRRRQRRRDRRAQLRDRLRRQGRRVHGRRRRPHRARRSTRATTTSRARRSRARPSTTSSRHLRQARREHRARARRALRDDRRPPRRLQAHPERPRHHRRARRARRRRPDERAGPRGRARHRAAHRERRAPRTSHATTCPPTSSRRERAVLEEQTRNEGKPEQALGKIVEGKLNGFFKTVALLEQAFVKDPKTTIERSSRASAAARASAASRASRSARSKRVPSTHDQEPLMPESQYRRVVLKLSGEAFADKRIGFGIDADVVQRIAEEVAEARARPRRRDRDRRRRRQHLARHDRRDARHGPRPRRLHGHARHRDQRAGAAGRARSGWASRPGCRPRSRWRRSPSRSSRCGRSATSRRAGS